ncbi:hypothetical protein FB45DRAFT_863245 [Roridomyces roridus]|uniref:Uncharacterized protein n=1 Tax=Roridomyces roridus TaxID=1738132 RepID=A0AAD7CB51_9AGAR|nr:hypothetical protein FB45DRAFT_863245 [Roridomyces roridus]
MNVVKTNPVISTRPSALNSSAFPTVGIFIITILALNQNLAPPAVTGFLLANFAGNPMLAYNVGNGVGSPVHAQPIVASNTTLELQITCLANHTGIQITDSLTGLALTSWPGQPGDPNTPVKLPFQSLPLSEQCCRQPLKPMFRHPINSGLQSWIKWDLQIRYGHSLCNDDTVDSGGAALMGEGGGTAEEERFEGLRDGVGVGVGVVNVKDDSDMDSCADFRWRWSVGSCLVGHERAIRQQSTKPQPAAAVFLIDGSFVKPRGGTPRTFATPLQFQIEGVVSYEARQMDALATVLGVGGSAEMGSTNILRITRFVIINKLLPREMDVARLNKEWVVPEELPLGYEGSSTGAGRVARTEPDAQCRNPTKGPKHMSTVEGQKYMPGVTWVLDIEPIAQC